MHVGYAPAFQNPGNARSDAEVYRQELRLAEMAEPLGFDSVWSIEHHFTDYTMCPDAVQFLSYMAGKTTHAKLGTMVIVLPWHDPVRVAEQISLLDHLSGGRMILGLGRGLARVEYEGFRIDQNEGRQRFLEYAQLVLNALEKGYVEGGEELAYKYIGAYYHTAMKHYEMASEHFGSSKSYEFYRHVHQYIGRHGMEGAAKDFVNLMPWGTPDQVLEKLAFIRDTIHMNGTMFNFSYAGMPYDEAERSLKCFAKHVLPELKKWDTPPLVEPAPLSMPASAAAAA